MPDITCKQFSDFLSRKSEHLDDLIIEDIRPVATLIGWVETAQLKAEDGTSHTFDRWNDVFPEMTQPWEDVVAGSCVGQPCFQDPVLIGLGYTRDMYKLQKIPYETSLFCYDQIMSADRAKQQFAYVVKNLRRATDRINSNRLRLEMFRIAGYHWIATMNRLVPFTFNENGTDMINVSVLPGLPTSKLVMNMLRQRVESQILAGALDVNVKDVPPAIEVLTDMETIWDLMEGDTTLNDHWRFNEFKAGSKEYYKYGWAGQVGNFMLHADIEPIRFQIVGNNLQRVFPYINIPATQGIKSIPNPAYITAPVQASLIWHRRAMINRMRDTTSINAMMPFAGRNYGGKWQFLKHDLTCGWHVAKNATGQDIRVPTPVDNSLQNQGKFHADFSYATQAQYPEFAEVFLHLREPACIVGKPLCSTPTYVEQDYNSANEVCPTPIIES